MVQPPRYDTRVARASSDDATVKDEIFISYAHLDNQELIEGQKGWISNFHRALEIRLGQLLGKAPKIWRDPKLQGNDLFADILVDKVRDVAVLVSIMSPRYAKSEWTRRELTEFWNAAQTATGVHIEGRARVFKVLKTPVALDQQPPEIQQLLGYEFFKVDPETGRARELDQIFGAEAQRDFWMKVDDVAHDICRLLQKLEREATERRPTAVDPKTIFLAVTTRDRNDDRETLRRDLQQHGHTVLPSAPLPSCLPDIEAALREDIEKCALSVHLIGKNYGVVPEESSESLIEIQNRIAAERAGRNGFARLIWIPPSLEPADDRQRAFIERLRTATHSRTSTDLLETPLEDLCSCIRERLKPAVISVPAFDSAADSLTRIYFIYDQRDLDSIAPWSDFLFDQGLEVIHPAFDGDEAELRECHQENVRSCDAALIHYGAANEGWLRRKLRDIQKSPGYGRNTPMRAVGISVAPPNSPQKQLFRTHEAILIPQQEGFRAEPWAPFIERAKSGAS